LIEVTGQAIAALASIFARSQMARWCERSTMRRPDQRQRLIFCAFALSRWRCARHWHLLKVHERLA
jgi:hypothetical protein